MKKYIFSLLILAFTLGHSQTDDFDGVYTASDGDMSWIWIFSDGYSSLNRFVDGDYVTSYGGPYTLEDNFIVTQVEFMPENSDQVGSKAPTVLHLTKTGFSDDTGIVWTKATPHDQGLDGTWMISGRYTPDGEFRAMQHSGTRKTLKVLKDGYFQWFAIDPGEKAFYGTGGGKYTFENGKYTEEILFFSRDSSRVGAKLEFNGEVKDGDWHHSGFSSKGDPIYEVWSRVK